MMGAIDAVQNFYVQVRGVTTGLICALQIANIYLEQLDDYVVSTFNDNLQMYARYVDDVIVIHTCTVVELLQTFNAFEDNIAITHEEDESDRSGHFLDLAYSTVGSRIHYETYRKPLAAYAFTPFQSCHHQSVFSAIVAT